MVSVPHETSDEVLYRQYDYDEETVIVADLGRRASEASVDVVDGTAIVVLEIDGDQQQYEFELPSADAHTFISNGVLTIEVGEE